MFSTPIWLLGLIPWAALAVWLLLRRHDVTVVPFLPLWLDTISRLGRRLSVGRPPTALICILLAIFMSVLGAAGPRIGEHMQSPTPRPTGRAVITLLSASDRPHPQVMVHITTIHFDRPTVELKINSAHRAMSQLVSVDANGVKNVFVDLQSFGPTLTASLDQSPAVSIHRQGQAISLAADANVPGPLRRLISLMNRQGDEKSIGVDPALAPERTGIVLAPPISSDTAQWTVVDDPADARCRLVEIDRWLCCRCELDAVGVRRQSRADRPTSAAGPADSGERGDGGLAEASVVRRVLEKTRSICLPAAMENLRCSSNRRCP